MEYKITIKNQLTALRILIYNSIGFVGLAFYFYYQIGYIFVVEASIFIYYLIMAIPAIYTHIQYYRLNKNDMVTFDMSQHSFRINNGDLILFKDIETIIVYMSFVKYRKGFVKYLPSDNYQYARFKFKGREEYILTSLMIPELEEFINTIKNVQIERKRLVIPVVL
jgi:hypothetical protein